MSRLDPIAVVTTVGTLADAQAIARLLVERRLAACAQISQIQSIYRWQGAVHDEPEYRLVIKTTRERYRMVESAIRELHPYDLPAIHALAFDEAYAPYAQWIGDSCKEQP